MNDRVILGNDDANKPPSSYNLALLDNYVELCKYNLKSIPELQNIYKVGKIEQQLFRNIIKIKKKGDISGCRHFSDIILLKFTFLVHAFNSECTKYDRNIN